MIKTRKPKIEQKKKFFFFETWHQGMWYGLQVDVLLTKLPH